MDSLTWLGFGLSVMAILVISRWHLAASLFAASLILAVFTLTPDAFGSLGLDTFTNPGIVMMAVAVALIPMIGGYMEVSGQMRQLVRNMRVSRKGFLTAMPAVVGMLPMPGGALLSAPMVKMGGRGVTPEAKAALNVWFRHVLYLVYPLSTALIVSTYLAGLTVYGVIPYLFPFLALSLVLGWVFFLGGAKGRMGSGEFSWKGVVVPLGVLLIAPALDFVLLTGFRPAIRESALVAAVLVSFILAAYFARANLGISRKVAARMKPWNYGLIIMGMFLFLAVFTSSGVPELIGGLHMPDIVLCVGVGFLLGIATGRIQVPASIIIPIYLGTAGLTAMAPLAFAVTYVGIFVGYVISPVHPCISVSLEYFGVGLKDYIKRMAWPSIIMVVIAIIVGMMVF